MIAYQSVGPLPRLLTEAMLKRIARACVGVRGLVKNGVVGIRFVSSAEMQRLNRAYRGKNRPTDVLSFAATEGKAFPRLNGSKDVPEIGDLVVCTTVAVAEAKRRFIQPVEELVRLIVHGTLHLSGMDHATQRDEERMFALQEQIIEKALGVRR